MSMVLVVMAAALAGPALAQAKASAKTLTVLGFSGSNAKYMVIRDSEFYDNGAGVVPNTWKPEPYEPASDGVIEHNLIYWNNFDYFRPNSPVKTTNSGINGQNDNFPTGAGVMLFGTARWTVKENSIIGNFLWGAAAFSDPTNDTGKAISIDNRFVDNKMGAAFHDANGSDFLYPTCPSSAGTGAVAGNPTQVLKLAAVALAKPPTSQEKYWHVHPHPARKSRKPYEG